jgi:hypothetical protein
LAPLYNKTTMVSAPMITVVNMGRISTMSGGSWTGYKSMLVVSK